MELDLQEPLLKRIKIGELAPELRHEVLQLAIEMGHEATITASSRADVLLKLYRTEKAKEKKSQKRLKKAEELILAVSSLQFDRSQQAVAREEEKKKGKARIPGGAIDAMFPVNTAMKRLFESIGITDEKAMISVLEALGDEKTKERIELVKMMQLEEGLVKRIMPLKWAVLQEPNDGAFLQTLERVEVKKEMIDAWAKANSRVPPEEANYNKNPGVLWEDFHTISRMLDIKPREEPWIKPPETSKRAEMQYRGKPMDPEDFIKVVQQLGFSVIRETKHGTMVGRGENITIVAKAHKKQMMLNTSTIKKMLTDASVKLNEFETARRELGL
jgi:predicted RNA binding protein YcfA (HicA-like mRNA interferase family)